MDQVTERPDINGWGVDARPESRPGVPMEAEPKPWPTASWSEPVRQTPTVPIQTRVGLDRPTPVFGTAVPPRGVSGLLRRAAYRVPEHSPAHWMLLMLGDRVDVLEHGDGQRWGAAAAIAVIGVTIALQARR